MRQALIIGARPSFTEGKDFPTVPLGEGLWRFQTEGHKDSVVTVLIEQGEEKQGVELHEPNIHQFRGPLLAKAKIEKRGTEPYINVFAELIK